MIRDTVLRAGIVLSLLAAPVVGLSAAATPPTAPAAPAAPQLARLTANEVVNRSVAARGGLSAWKGVNTLTWKGKMGAGGTVYEAVTAKATLQRQERPEAELPFALEFKRPYRSRLELQFSGQTAVQVYDGKQGYKYRPFLGRTDWEPYTKAELAQAAAEPGVDGLLVDFAAKGSRVELAGTDSVEGHPAYKLKVTLKNGQVRHVWVDGTSFLELKLDGEPRKLDGKLHPVAIYLRDYKAEQGLMIPHLIETAVEGVPKTEKIIIESVAVNPSIDDSRFTKAKQATGR
jgi:outer membrane lipoprotein-sorting protein